MARHNTVDRAQHQNEQSERDPTQVVPPWVDTGMRVRIPFYDEVPARNFIYAGPGVLVLLAGAYTFLFGGPLTLAAPLLGVGALLAAIGYRVASRTDYSETTAADRFLGPFRRRRDARSLPLDQEEAADPAEQPSGLRGALRRLIPFARDHRTHAHDVARLFEDGTALMNDDRMVGMVRLEGRNTDLQTDAEARPMIGRLRTALDEDVAGVNIPFRLYSTTLEYDPESVTAPYRRAWHESYVGTRWQALREYLRDIVGFEHEATERLETREWRHYAVVSVAEDDVDLPEFAAGQQVDAERLDALRRQRQREAVHDRLRTVGGAFRQTPGVETSSVGPAELAMIVARRWTGTTHQFDDDAVTGAVDAAVWPHASEPASSGDPATRAPHQPGAVASDATGEATTAAVTRPLGSVPPSEGANDTRTEERPVGASAYAYANPADDPELSEEEAADAGLLAGVRDALFSDGADGRRQRGTAGSGTDTDRIADLLAGPYDVGDGYVQAGSQYVRTYWVAGWPTAPREKFLRDLYTMRGVDVEVTLRCEPWTKRDAKDEVKDQISEVDADIDERKKAGDVAAMLEERDMDPWTKMYILLHETPAQAWDLTGYVTVRAGDREALDRAEGHLRDGLLGAADLSLDVEKRQALEAACSDVTSVLSRSPAQLTPVTDANRQGEMFTSAGPLGRDAFAEGSHRDRASFTLSGTIAAAFPPVAPTVQQDDGVLEGRLAADGSSVAPDPFDPGPAHQLLAGASGSGKTTYVIKKALRWWVAGEDRTLILCDTMGEFGGLTELCHGERITLDGQTTINPLHIEETPEEVLRHLDKDPFEMKFQEAANFILDVITNEPSTRDRFTPLVKDALRQTYIDAGVIPSDPSTHTPENSPDMTDYTAMVEYMGDNPEEFAIGSLDAKEIERNAGPLLRKLAGFKPDGELSSLTGETEAHIRPGGVSYLDLSQIEGLGGAADKSTTLMLMLGQVYQAIKRSEGPAVFVIDEAHYLLKSETMLGWLDQAARHWRHYNAGLWFVSQHPDDFAVGKNDAIQESLNAIRQQTTATTLFATDEDISAQAAAAYKLNAPQVSFLSSKAKRGEDGVGYTDCLMAFEEREGWHHVNIQLSPLELAVAEYDPQVHGAFDEYLRRRRDVDVPGDTSPTSPTSPTSTTTGGLTDTPDPRAPVRPDGGADEEGDQ